MSGYGTSLLMPGFAQSLQIPSPPRPAAAGGSSHRPPPDHAGPAQIIPFPGARADTGGSGPAQPTPSPGARPAPGGAGPAPARGEPAPASSPGGDGAIWAQWMTGIIGPREARVQPDRPGPPSI